MSEEEKGIYSSFSTPGLEAIRKDKLSFVQRMKAFFRKLPQEDQDRILKEFQEAVDIQEELDYRKGRKK